MSDQDGDSLQMCPIYIANNESQGLPFLIPPIDPAIWPEL